MKTPKDKRFLYCGCNIANQVVSEDGKVFCKKHKKVETKCYGLEYR